MVRNLHAAGLQASGADEGAPGFRAKHSDHFYVGYLYDPLGNQVAIFCTNLAEGTRGLRFMRGLINRSELVGSESGVITNKKPGTRLASLRGIIGVLCSVASP